MSGFRHTLLQGTAPSDGVLLDADDQETTNQKRHHSTHEYGDHHQHAMGISRNAWHIRFDNPDNIDLLPQGFRAAFCSSVAVAL